MIDLLLMYLMRDPGSEAGMTVCEVVISSKE
jgi:hypothetical protein